MNLNNLQIWNLYSDESSNCPNLTWVNSLNLYRPLCFYKQTTESAKINIHYSERGLPSLKRRFEGNLLDIYKIYIKREPKYLVCAGCIFKYDKDNKLAYPLVIYATSGNKIVLLIDKEVNNTELKAYIKKHVESLPQGIDVIWTNNITQFCFNEAVDVFFKSFKDQRKYFQHVADEWVKSQKVNNPPLPVTAEQEAF